MSTNAGASNADHATAEETTKIKIPQFLTKDVQLWFTLVEQAFAQFNLTDDAKRVYYVVPKLEQDILILCSDVLSSTSTNKYDQIKERIIKRYSDSQEKKMNTLLNGIDTRGKRPTEVLQELRRLANGTVTETVLRTMWLRHLPRGTQTALMTQDSVPIDVAAAFADRFYDLQEENSRLQQINTTPATTPSASTHMAAHSYVTVDNVKQMFTDFETRMLDSIKTLIRSQSRATSPARSTTSETTNISTDSRGFPRRRMRTFVKNNLCTYHFRFGADAHRCMEGCRHYQPPAENKQSGQ